MLYALRTDLDDRPVLSNWQKLLDYLRGAMAFEKNEHVRLLHLNARNILTLDEILSRGTIDQATVHVREVIVRALEVGSASIILVHNHPSGDPSPSRADIEITRAIIDAGKTIGLTVHDHLIVGSSGHVSLRARGLI